MTAAVIDLGLGTIHLDPAFDEAPFDAAGRHYGPPGGLAPLRAALARIEGVAADEIVITTGASLGLAATLATLERPGRVLLPRPYYPGYPGLLRCLGFRGLHYAVAASNRSCAEPGIDIGTVAPTLGEVRAIIVNTPGNPLGNLVSADEMRELHRLALAAGCLTITDEAYADLVYEPRDEDWRGAGALPGWVRIRSFSKSLRLPGERLGYVVAERELADRIARAHWAMAMSPPVPGQLRVAQALAERADFVDDVRAMLMRRRDLLGELLADHGEIQYRPPRAGLFAWLQSTVAVDSHGLDRACLASGVRVMPGHVFGVEHPPAMRCSFALPELELRAGVERLLTAMDSLA